MARRPGRPKSVEPYVTYNAILFERQMEFLRRIAHQQGKGSVAALLRDMIDERMAQQDTR